MTTTPLAWILGLAVSLSIGVVPVHADNWPGWRGPTDQGITQEKDLPVQWSTSENVVWKVPLQGAGVSSPVVWEDRIFLTASDGRRNDQLHVLCFHRKDGRQLWHVKLFGTAPTNLYPPGGMAVPTPVTDGKSLYVLFGTGDLACLDFAGGPRWIRSLAQEYGPFKNRWGMGSSPLLVEDSLVIQVDHWGQSYLMAVDTRSGKTRWKIDRETHVNWSSPVAIQVNGRKEIVTVGTEKVHSYDARTGKLLWTVTGIYEQCVASPVVCDGLVLVGSGVSTLAIRPDGKTGDLTKSHVLWNNKRAKAYVPSVMCYKGLVYLAGSKGISTCLNAETGEQVWKARMGGQFHASPVAGADNVYFVSKEGVVTVIRAGKKYQVLARNDMGELIVASPALSNGQIFLRGENHLFCIGQKEKD